ncbi:MAG: hypothetical protein AAFP70_17610, partial [Calditrichota bacterium]
MIHKLTLRYLLFMLFCLPYFLSAGTIHVPADAATVQAGIDSAQVSDTVLVAPGTYLETINFNGKAIVVGSWFLLDRDTSYIAQTILDGNQSGSVVTFDSGEDSTSVLTGFTVTNGYTNIAGGGVYCRSADPKLEWLMISNNTVDDPIINTDGGGGIGCLVASPVIRNVMVVNNQTLGPRSTGGGIWLLFSNAILSDVNVIDNSSGDCCGGVHIDFGNPKMERMLIKGNKAVASTGGISIGWSNATLTDAVIDSNQAGRGGGMVTGLGAPTLKNITISRNRTGPTGEGGGLLIGMDSDLSSWENVRIEGNRAGLRGGGVAIDAISTDTIYISNLTVVNNSVDSFDGGGIYINNMRPVLNNVTVTGNSAPRNGGGIFGRGTLKPILINCIVYGNTSSTTEVHIDDGDITIAHSNIREGINGITLRDGANLNWLDGNINADPFFTDTLTGDYTLSANSPCIDAGTAFLEIEGEVFLDLPASEYLGIAPDMGSAEFDPSVNIDPSTESHLIAFELFQNYPNPFNPQTEIKFRLPE